MPSEVSRHVLRNRSEGSSGEKVFDQLFEEPYQENDRPIDDSLKQNRSNHGSRVKTAQEWHCICDQHRLSYNQGRYGCDHEAPKAEKVVSEKEVGGQDDEIEANCEEHLGGTTSRSSLITNARRCDLHMNGILITSGRMSGGGAQIEVTDQPKKS